MFACAVCHVQEAVRRVSHGGVAVPVCASAECTACPVQQLVGPKRKEGGGEAVPERAEVPVLTKDAMQLVLLQLPLLDLMSRIPRVNHTLWQWITKDDWLWARLYQRSIVPFYGATPELRLSSWRLQSLVYLNSHDLVVRDENRVVRRVVPIRSASHCGAIQLSVFPDREGPIRLMSPAILHQPGRLPPAWWPPSASPDAPLLLGASLGTDPDAIDVFRGPSRRELSSLPGGGSVPDGVQDLGATLSRYRAPRMAYRVGGPVSRQKALEMGVRFCVVPKDRADPHLRTDLMEIRGGLLVPLDPVTALAPETMIILESGVGCIFFQSKFLSNPLAWPRLSLDADGFHNPYENDPAHDRFVMSGIKVRLHVPSAAQVARLRRLDLQEAAAGRSFDPELHNDRWRAACYADDAITLKRSSRLAEGSIESVRGLPCFRVAIDAFLCLIDKGMPGADTENILYPLPDFWSRSDDRVSLDTKLTSKSWIDAWQPPGDGAHILFDLDIDEFWLADWLGEHEDLQKDVGKHCGLRIHGTGAATDGLPDAVTWEDQYPPRATTFATVVRVGPDEVAALPYSCELQYNTMQADRARWLEPTKGRSHGIASSISAV